MYNILYSVGCGFILLFIVVALPVAMILTGMYVCNVTVC